MVGSKTASNIFCISMATTWRDDRCTHSSSDLYVHNYRQHQALERDEQRLQRYVGLQHFFNEDYDTMYCTGNRYIRKVYGAWASSKVCGVCTQLWDVSATAIFRRVLALSNVDIKPSVLLGVRIIKGLMSSLLHQSGSVHFYLIFYTFPKMWGIAFILIVVWGWQATGNLICLKIPSDQWNITKFSTYNIESPSAFYVFLEFKHFSDPLISTAWHCIFNFYVFNLNWSHKKKFQRRFYPNTQQYIP